MIKIPYTIKDFLEDFQYSFHNSLDSKIKKSVEREIAGMQFGDKPTHLIKIYKLYKQRAEDMLLTDEIFMEMKKSDGFKDKIGVNYEDYMNLFGDEMLDSLNDER